MSVPKVRNAANTEWIDVFCKGGWKMKTLQGDYITLTPHNTKFRNADNTGWIDFTCPVPVPSRAIGGSLRSNRRVDGSGYLWMTGYSFGVYEDGTTQSKTWQKVKYSTTGEYIRDVKTLEAGTHQIGHTYPPTYVFLRDGRVLYSGNNQYGQRGDGTAGALQNQITTISDVTDKWKAAIGDLNEIAWFSRAGFLIRKDGVAFVLGETGSEYVPSSNSATRTQFLGQIGAPMTMKYTSSAIFTTFSIAATWQPMKITRDGITSSTLQGVAQLARTSQGWVFAMTADGELLQPSLWFNSGTKSRYPSGLTQPKKIYDAMRPLYTPFPQGVPKTLHEGGVVETETGELFYPYPKPIFEDDYFYKFEWRSIGLNTQVFGSPVVKLVSYLRGGGSFSTNGYTIDPTVFILLEDGRLYATGDNTSGWFGIGAMTKTDPGAPVLLNTNVKEFDVDYQACILTKKDDAMWGAGSNVRSMGVNQTGVYIRDWTQCVFTSL